MLKVIPSGQHKIMNYDWLKTEYHFSFGEYYNPERISFGPLRVFNHDVIQPGKGFDFHQHRDMEIVTYVIDGELEHKDNFGNHGIIQSGEVQRMSAGTGVFHAEFNHSKTKPLRLLQVWIFTKHKNLKPSWEQQKFTKEERKDKLLPVISPNRENNSMSINQDASFYISSVSLGMSVNHTITKGRQAYIYLIDGAVDINSKNISAGDSVEATEAGQLSITAKNDSEIILIDIPVEYEKNIEAITLERKA